ncbi:PLAT/LH2 domain-containing protein [Paenibacillus elgii]|uniref:PLAT/LH2 domain-containing protein n=1 Tax=Paenibacillus elgii TaxID=189691 RepID=UPI00203AC4A6|nr:PLAT/LH2 domain-containing protein [Paenibacillus elgii]MCM3272653.1 hypothetical protein [Paenibacillus elgii]
MKLMARILSVFLAIPLLMFVFSVSASASAVSTAGTKTYTVTVKTADVADAGTNSKIQIKLHGNNGDAGWFDLNGSSSDPFERNAVDKDIFTLSDLGTVKTLEIFSDGSGNKSGWKVEYIKVNDGTNTWFFYYNNWIGENGAQIVTFTK